MKGPMPLIIVSGPSGSGKSTVIRHLLADPSLRLRLSVSATTRPPRPGEKDGREYHFWTRERFERARSEGAFLEWADVHGNYYGTLRSEVEPYRSQGWIVLLDIDLQGAGQVRQKCPDVVTVFLQAPSWEVLERRLRARGTDSDASIQRRLTNARLELAQASDYDYQVVNGSLEGAVAQCRAIVQDQLEGHSNAG
jgi:guanylate kinase